MSSQNMVRVYYIGRKDVKQDNICARPGRAVRVWRGFGSHQDVSEQDWAQLQNYPDVWTANPDDVARIRKEREGEKMLQAARSSNDLSRLDPAQLRALADKLDREKAREDEEAAAAVKQTEAQENEDVTDRDVQVQAVVLALFTETGTVPKIKTVSEKFGANVTADELNRAIKALRHQGKLQKPSEQ